MEETTAGKFMIKNDRHAREARKLQHLLKTQEYNDHEAESRDGIYRGCG